MCFVAPGEPYRRPLVMGVAERLFLGRGFSQTLMRDTPISPSTIAPSLARKTLEAA